MALQPPVSNKRKCEKDYYTYTEDPISYFGREGNHIFKRPDFFLTRWISNVKIKFTLGLYLHKFSSYLIEEQSPLKDLKSRMPKDDSKKIVIERVLAASVETKTPSLFNGEEINSSGISCGDLYEKEQNIIKPSMPKPDHVIGWNYLIKMPGRDAVLFEPKDSKTPHFALSVEKAKSTKDSLTDQFIIRDAGPLALLGGSPTEKPKKSSNP